MKTIFTLLATLIFGIGSFASGFRPSGSIFVKSNDKGDVRVVLDGKLFQSGQNSLQIDQVRAGIHDLKIYRQRHSNNFSENYEMIYSADLPVKPGKQTSILIDRMGGVSIRESNFSNDQVFRGEKSDFENNSFNSYRDFRFRQVMNNRDFEGVLRAMQNEWFESNRMESAMHIINTNFFTSEQVKMLLSIFYFDGNRLDLAKIAFRKTVDPSNYQCVFDQLLFASSKAELSRYIQYSR